MEGAYQKTQHPSFQIQKLIWAPLKGVSKFKNNVMRKKMRRKIKLKKNVSTDAKIQENYY